MKTIVKTHTYNGNEQTTSVKEDDMLTQSTFTKYDEYKRIISTGTNNRKVEFIYNDKLDPSDILFDLATGIKVTERDDNGALREYTGEGSINRAGDMIFYRLPQFFGLTDDEPCVEQTYLTVYLINKDNTRKGVIAEKVYAKDDPTPETEIYVIYYDDNFEMISMEITVANGIFPARVDIYKYDDLGRRISDEDMILGDVKKYSYIDDNHYEFIIERGSILISKGRVTLDDKGRVITEELEVEKIKAGE